MDGHTLALLLLLPCLGDATAAKCRGETCHLWAEHWADFFLLFFFVKTEAAAWIHLSDRPPTSLLIAPSSDAASSSNWQSVGVDGMKMVAALFTSMTAACQLHREAKWTWRSKAESGRERERESAADRGGVKWDKEKALFLLIRFLFLIIAFNRSCNVSNKTRENNLPGFNDSFC